MTATVGANAPHDMNPDGQGRSVLRRSAAVLEAFTEMDRTLTLGELSQRVDLPKSTLHRLAERLVEVGWLERTGGGYQIGLRLFEIGALAYRRTRLIEIAAPRLQDLSQRSGLAVQLGVLDRNEVVYLERIPTADFQLPTRDGGRMPAHCTGLGKAMLGFAEHRDIAEDFDFPLERLTPNTITDEDALLAELVAVREQGYAVDDEEACLGISCVAAPIRGSGRAIGALSVCGPSDRVHAGLSAAVVSATRSIWSDLFPTSAGVH